MRILLVYPEFPDTFWSFKHALRFIRKRSTFPPLGLLTVAAILPEHWEKRLVDMNTEPLTQRDLAWADCVFVSAMIVQRESAKEVLARAKAAGARTVAGGPLFIAEHQDLDNVDHLVLDEGEVTLPPFVRDVEKGEAKPIYRAEEYVDLTQSPTPMWELINMRHYSAMCIQYSRGCPFNCDFCNVTAMLGHVPRTKTADQIIAELDGLYALGWRGGLFFVDDNFIGNKRKLKTEILPALIAWRQGKQGYAFQTEASINLADDPELTQMMVDAGFDTVFVGIETPDEESLKECKKVQNRGRDLVESVKVLQRAGLQVQGGFIVGFDSDTPNIFQRQVEFIQRSGIVTAMVGLLQAPPGTKLYERMKSEGRLIDKMTGDNTDNTMNFLPKMEPEALRDGYRYIMSHIYSPRGYYERVRTFLREYRRPPVLRFRISFDELHALFQSVVELGVRGKEWREYWRLFFWTLFRRPQLLPEAITLAIYGSHFRRICEMHDLQ